MPRRCLLQCGGCFIYINPFYQLKVIIYCMDKQYWKVWLRKNLLSKVDNEYIALVSTSGRTASRNTDIARQIVKERTEYQYETILNILNQSDHIKREMLLTGNSLLTGVCHITPRITGNWTGANAKFDPEANKITLDMTPSAEMRLALKDVGVDVIGVKDSGAFIGMVVDTATGVMNSTITAEDDIRIDGEKIKVVPEDETGVGVFLVDADGLATPFKRRLTQNDPKRIIARVPALPAGQYTLRIVTRFSNGTVLLKEQRVIEFYIPLVISD
jgi:hypothetical protein